MIRLNTHLKRMIVKASMMGWSIQMVHERIDEILDKYGVKNKTTGKTLISEKINEK